MSVGVLVAAPGWVAGEHIRAFQADSRSHVAAIWAGRDSERARAAEYARRFNLDCVITDDYEAALALSAVQAVTVCSINCFHYGQALAAIRAGKHVLVEKPVALSLDEVRRLALEAGRAGVLTHAGHIVRYYPAIRALKGLIERGALGAVYHAEADYWHALSGGWKVKKDTAGSAMLMGGIHALDLVRHLLGETRKAEWVSAVASGPFLRQDFDYPPNVEALIRYEDGATARVGVGLEANMPYVFHLQVNGSGGTIRQNGIHSPGFFPGVSRFVEIPSHYPDDWDVAGHPFGEEVADFLDAVESGTPSMLDFRHALATYELLEAIERSAATGRPVRPGSAGDVPLCMPF
ncbi:Gfo/Idh/MocA family oxidoreductase [bacterium]|nr:Gfo/Idh/MocA family oxidoreductase [bacterium]